MAAGTGLLSNSRAVTPHILAGNGFGRELEDLRNDVKTAFVSVAAIAVDEYINPVAAGAAVLLAATATLASGQVQTITSFLAGGVASLAAFPRNLTFTTAGVTPANAPANVVVTGTYRGLPQTETITIAQTAAAATGVKPFSAVSKIVYATSDGAAATISMGIGLGLGLSQKPKAMQTTFFYVQQEVVDVTVVTNGVVTAEGLYTPNTAPNGAHDYTIVYMFDATL